MDAERLASTEEAKLHLDAFIAAFVDPARRDRWRSFMFDKPEKAARALHKLPLDNRRATWLDHKQRGSSTLLASLKGRLGVYFTLKTPPVWMYMDDAAVASDWECEDAIFSIVPGKLAIYFNHDHVTSVLQAE